MKKKDFSKLRQVSNSKKTARQRKGGDLFSSALKGFAAYKGYQGAKSAISGAKNIGSKAYNTAKKFISPVTNYASDKIRKIPTAPPMKGTTATPRGLTLDKIRKIEKPKEGVVKRIINKVKRKIAPSKADQLASKFSQGTELLDMKSRTKKLDDRKKLGEKEIKNFQAATGSTKVPERLANIVSPSAPGKSPTRSDGEMFYDAEDGSGIKRSKKVGGSLATRHKFVKMRLD